MRFERILKGFQTIAASKATTIGPYPTRSSEAGYGAPDGVLVGLRCMLGPLVDKAIKNELECRTLMEIRDQLLLKSISGELSAPAT